MPADLRIVEFDSIDSLMWDDFVRRNSKGTVYHTRAWQVIIESAFNYQAHHLCAKDDADRIQGVLPLVRLKSRIFGDFMVSLPFVNYCGSLANDPAVEVLLTQHACELADELGVSHVEFRDRKAREPGWAVRTDKIEMILELRETTEEQWKRLRGTVRNRIRKATKSGATVQIGGPELVPDFYRVFSRNMRDLGTPVYGRHFFTEIINHLGNLAEIVVVYLNDSPVAAGLLIHHGPITEIPSSSSIREFNRLSVNTLLHWECLKRAIQRGARRFDFGRCSVDSGTYHFKKRWGAEPIQLYWHYWLRDGGEPPKINPDNAKYALGIKAWKCLPLWISNRLGPHLAGLLP